MCVSLIRKGMVVVFQALRCTLHAGAAAALRMAEVEDSFYQHLAQPDDMTGATDNTALLDTSLKQVDVDDLLQRLAQGALQYDPTHNPRYRG